MPIFSEGLDVPDEEEQIGQTQLNSINTQDAGVDLKDINY